MSERERKFFTITTAIIFANLVIGSYNGMLGGMLVILPYIIIRDYLRFGINLLILMELALTIAAISRLVISLYKDSIIFMIIMVTTLIIGTIAYYFKLTKD